MRHLIYKPISLFFRIFDKKPIKNQMLKILRQIHIFFIFFIIPLFAKSIDFDVFYKQRPDLVTEFEECDRGFSGILVIILSDGSKWLVDKNMADEVHAKISQGWRVGDDIRIKENLEHSKIQRAFTLKNVRTGDAVLTYLSIDCANPERAMYIRKIDENGHALVTSQGHEWSIGLMGSYIASQWRPQERVIINKGDQSKKEQYYLISTCHRSFCWGNLIFWKTGS